MPLSDRRVNIASEDFLPPHMIALIEDPRPVLEVVGMLLAEESREAWKRRSYGGVPWPEQYEGMGDSEFIHIAGAIQDLKKGPSIKSRRFDRHDPPLVDTGLLRNSVDHRVVSRNVVEAGVVKNVLDYASVQNAGGKSTPVAITGVIRKNLFTVMQAARAKGKTPKLQTLGFLFSVDSFEQDIAQRPFIGITSRARRMIPFVVKSIYEGKPIDEIPGAF